MNAVISRSVRMSPLQTRNGSLQPAATEATAPPDPSGVASYT